MRTSPTPHTTDASAWSTEEAMERLRGGVHDLRARLAEAVVGQHTVVDRLLIALFTQGHALIVGVPGLAKTLLVRTLADAVGLSFARVQCTPDMMPADIIGADLIQFDPETGRRALEFAPGPVFTNLLLADELNRATPRTQAALLEAMAERQVTAGGRTHVLHPPFVVIATQNPIEQEGTYPLPEAQLDRFMLSLWMDYPTRQEERTVIAGAEARRSMSPSHTRSGDPTTPTAMTARAPAGVEGSAPASTLSMPMPGRQGGAVLSAVELQRFRDAIGSMPVAGHVVDAVVDLVRATRPGDPRCPMDGVGSAIAWGASPRAGADLLLAARCVAAMQGRPTPTLADVREVAVPVLRHRVLLNYAGLSAGLRPEAVVEQIAEAVVGADEQGRADG